MFLLLFQLFLLTNSLITSTPPISVRIGEQLSYRIATNPTSPVGLVSGPISATVVSNTLTWTPGPDQVSGSETFQLRAADGSSQNFTVSVDFAKARINCGGPTIVDSNGFVWSEDNFFFGGRLFSLASAIANTNVQEVYQTERWIAQSVGPLIYRIPVPAGRYDIELHFAEIFPLATSAGFRVFEVTLEGSVMISRLDVFSVSGGLNRALVRTFTDVNVADGIVEVSLRGLVQNAKINAIVVLQKPVAAPTGSVPTITSTPPLGGTIVGATWTYQVVAVSSTAVTFSLTGPTGATISSTGLVSWTPGRLAAGTNPSFTVTVRNNRGPTTQTFTVTVDRAIIRINCGGPDVVDQSGLRWSADAGFNTGNPFSNFTRISATNDPILYQTHRWDPATLPDMVYTFNVPRGKYVVQLHFAEIWGGARDIGLRRFTVNVEGVTFLADLDVTRTVGWSTALVREAVVDVLDGVLTIGVQRGVQNPFISAIAVFNSVDNGGCVSGDRICGGVCVSRFDLNNCGTCGNVCPAGRTCDGTACVDVVCNFGAGFVMQNGRCVFPTTCGRCPGNRIDCTLGCVQSGVTNNLCQGGQCIDGQCVPNQITVADSESIKSVVLQFLSDSVNGTGAARGIPKEPRLGDTAGALIRWTFHDMAPANNASGCLLVRPCGTNNCEFNNPANAGLEDIMNLLDKVYDDNCIAFKMNKPDFYYFAATQFLNFLSSGAANIPFRWGRKPCAGVNVVPPAGRPVTPLPFFPGTLPEPEMPFSQLTDIMETRLGFTRQEWFCLIGAHALGRMQPQNSGYARHWTTKPNTFDNHFFVEVDQIPWRLETNLNFQTMLNVTDENQPTRGHTQYGDATCPRFTCTAMLKSDMEMFWLTSDRVCDVTHGGDGCPRRLDNGEFNILTRLSSPDSTFFFDCFRGAWTKMIERGQSPFLSNFLP